MKKRNQKPNFLDDFIGIFSPKARLKRLQYKAAASLIKRKYEGASVGRRTSGWWTPSTDSNSEIAGALNKLRNRARDLVRNNPWASRGLQVISANVVGSGIHAKIKAGSDQRQKKLMEKWKAWANTTACDYDGQLNLIGIQRLIMRSTPECGEVIIRLRRTKRRVVNGVEVPPIALQVLESDFIDSNKQTSDLKNGNTMILGVEFNKNTGKKEAYHLFKDHPGAMTTLSITRSDSVRVPANEVAHIYRPDRPGQVRGASWFSPIMIRLRDLDEFEDAELVRQKIASMFTAFVHDQVGIDNDLSAKAEEELGEKMEPGLIEILPAGKDVKIAQPPSKDGYASYMKVMLHSIASGLGITYEALVGDLSETNFSSARLGKLEMNRNIDTWQQQIVIGQFLTPVFDWFLLGCELLGIKSDDVKVTWTPPAKGLVDPTKEIPAIKDAVRSGLMTLSEAIMERGKDPETHFEQIAEDNKTIDNLNLVLDSDPRVDQKKGQSDNASGQDD